MRVLYPFGWGIMLSLCLVPGWLDENCFSLWQVQCAQCNQWHLWYFWLWSLIHKKNKLFGIILWFSCLLWGILIHVFLWNCQTFGDIDRTFIRFHHESFNHIRRNLYLQKPTIKSQKMQYIFQKENSLKVQISWLEISKPVTPLALVVN